MLRVTQRGLPRSDTVLSNYEAPVPDGQEVRPRTGSRRVSGLERPSRATSVKGVLRRRGPVAVGVRRIGTIGLEPGPHCSEAGLR